jgi:ATP-binding protein involved in chromosome partitioning
VAAAPVVGLDLWESGDARACEEGQLLFAEALETDLLGRIPIDIKLRESSDEGVPLVIGDPESPAAKAIDAVAQQLGAAKQAETPKGIVGRKLPLSVG